MAKFKTSAGTAGTTGKQSGTANTQRSIMDSAQQIWLAGMGAFARAQEEGGKLFDTLVREGSTLEQKTRNLATGRVDAVREVVETGVGQVRERAADTWDRLEKVFEDRVQRALNGLGVPGREEVEALNRRIEALTAEVRKLSGGSTRAPRTAHAVRPAAARKPAARKAAPAAARKAPRKATGKKQG